MEYSKIAWTTHTFNIGWGCKEVSPGCANCYGASMSKRWGLDVWGEGKPRRTFDNRYWAKPIKWNREAAQLGTRVQVFCSSMCDIFEDHPTIEAERAKLWPLVRATPWLDWLILTKRPERIAQNLPTDWGNGWPNVWLGVTAENQAMTDLRIPILMSVRAAIRFVSYEPALERVNFHLGQYPVDWLIVGGETGGGARPFDMSWAEDAVRQCQAANVACFVKQLGCKPLRDGQRVRLGSYKGDDPEQWPEELRVRQSPAVAR